MIKCIITETIEYPGQQIIYSQINRPENFTPIRPNDYMVEQAYKTVAPSKKANTTIPNTP